MARTKVIVPEVARGHSGDDSGDNDGVSRRPRRSKRSRKGVAIGESSTADTNKDLNGYKRTMQHLYYI